MSEANEPSDPKDAKAFEYLEERFRPLIYVHFYGDGPNPVIREFGPYLAVGVLSDHGQMRLHVTEKLLPIEDGFVLAVWEGQSEGGWMVGGWKVNDGLDEPNAPLFVAVSFETIKLAPEPPKPLRPSHEN